MGYCRSGQFKQPVEWGDETMMRTVNSRFGDIEYDPENTLLFPEGLIGFDDLRHFVVMPNKKEGPLFWIQSVEDSQVAFVLTDPSKFFPDYQVAPDDLERKKLGIDEDDDCLVICVVTVPQSREITFNLAAPILFAPRTNRALQVVLDGSQFSTRTALPAA